MKRAYYIDTFSTGHLHEMFDAASLAMFASIYDCVEYRTSRSSRQQIQELLGELPANVSVSYVPTIHAYRGGRRWRFVFKQLQAVLHNVFYILTIPAGYDIIFNYNTLAALPMMNLAAKLRNNRILQICHGELVELAYQHSNNYLLKRGLRVFTSTKIAQNLYFAVLGQSIYNHIFPLVSEAVQKKLLQFEHPIVIPKLKNTVKSQHKKLVLGTIGAMRDSKGLDVLMALSKTIRNNPNVELRSVGEIQLPEADIDEAGIVIPECARNRFMTREEMYNQIRQLDYALFLYEPERYQFAASGSVFDAIACEIPIIALRNDYFEHLFNKYGEFGYLLESTTQICSCINDLANDAKQDKNVSLIIDKLHPLAIAQEFSKVWLPLDSKE